MLNFTSDFHRDNEWQRRIRDVVLAPRLYDRHAHGGRYVFIDKGKLASVLQKRYSVDAIMQGRDGRAICIEEKIVRWPGYVYRDFCLETDSCTIPGRESAGWMQYGQADYLLYCFETEAGDLDCYLIDFPALREWFWPRLDRYKIFGPLQTLNRSMGRKVPIKDVCLAVRTWRFALRSHAEPIGVAP